MKRLKFLVSLSLFSTLLYGCTTTYSKSDIEQYIEEELNISYEYSIGQSIRKKDQQGHYDTYYKITLKDDYLTTFYIVNDIYDKDDSVTNTLRTNYIDIRRKQAYDNYLDHETFTLQTVNSSTTHLKGYKIRATFSNKEELDTILEEADAFQEKVEEDQALCSSTYSITLDYTYVYDHFFTINNTFDTNYAEEKYVYSLMYYQIPQEELAQYSSEFKEEVFDFYGNENYVGLKQEDGTIQYLDDVIGEYYWQLSIGGFYRVLQEANYPTTGDVTSYSFTGIDGSTYEFSYANGGNYSKDGESLFYRGYISTTDIKEMTGLSVYVGEKEE